MKGYILFVFAALLAVTSAVFVPPRPGHKKQHVELLGAKECTWGPSYWCKNLTAAADCHAVPHCIQTVWIHKKLPPDTSSICQTCLDMVKQARDQLESNETQELIKEVFEGSCKLLHIKPIVKECDKIADDYIPELIDTLASEMNPQIHKLLIEAGEKIETKSVAKAGGPSTCEGCHTVVGILEDKFNRMSRDDVLHSLLKVCGKTGSFSDGCSNIVITYFNKIYQHLQNHLNAEEVCLMSGECSAQFHKHANVEITPMSHVGYLVHHLKDLLIANTTEDEFKKVMLGLCSQSGEFKQECESLVNQYYSVVYNYLCQNLDGGAVCKAIGICPSPQQEDDFFAPLLPPSAAELAENMKTDPKMARIPLKTDSSAVRVLPFETEQDVIPEQQIPIEAILPPHMQEKIKSALEKACTKLPTVVNDTCVNFIDTYEPALVAILAQDIDPSQICPLIRACPSKTADVEIFMQAKGDSKCPLCLFAENIEKALDKVCEKLPNNMGEECKDFVKTYSSELIEMLIADLKPEEVCVYLKLCQDTKPAPRLPTYVFRHTGGDIETNVIPDNTINGKFFDTKVDVVEDSPQCVLCEFVMKEIEDQLKNKDNDRKIEEIVRDICSVMPHSVKKQCNDFVDKYADTVIQLLIQALEPSEICTMMKICHDQLTTMKVEILDCPICEMTVAAMEKILGNPHVDHEIEHVLEKSCRGLPQKYRHKCYDIVISHGFEISSNLQSSKLSICKQIGYCRLDIDPCLYGPSYWCVSENTQTIVENIQHTSEGGDPCFGGPNRFCKSLEDANKCGEEARKLCEKKFWTSASETLLTNRTKREVSLPGSNPCTWGPSHWCASEENADKCNARAHCEQNVWGGSRPKRNAELIGGNPCTSGPSYWCASEANANKCDARAHCEQYVWHGSRPKRSAGLGSDPCTWGPSHWCASEENADKCNARAHCEKNVWGGSRPKRSAGLGSDPCTWGPSHWCASEENADKCNARAHCEQHVWGGSRTKRNAELIGGNPCTSGPSYWCASEANANKCDARAHCEQYVWHGSRPKRSAGLGSDPCTWGPSHWCASEENADLCNARAHCEKNVWGGSRPKRSAGLGSDPCTWGPSHWCASEENADLCNARAHCEKNVWGGSRPKRTAGLGSDPCTWGPSHWCASEENADKCDARAHCEQYVWHGSRPKRSAGLGSDPCTWGPSHWCASEENADKCNARAHCEQNVWGGSRPKRNADLGGNPCTSGPSYWCASELNADKCNARAHCEQHVWGGSRPKRYAELIGANPCTSGPSYWCASEANANRCDARAHCEQYVRHGSRPKRSAGLGSDPCTWGPSHWCASEENADKCNARAHCEQHVWGGSRPKRNADLVGGNPCTWGPSHWCASEENADKCNARAHCEQHVWGGSRPKQYAELIGANPCTSGPSYWCASEANANKCDARAHCEQYVWHGSSQREVQA
nr:unnamed protein product [Callosobruchus chinensis]